jgi:ribosomal protein S18 acetylase RimI-like enzyme
MTDLSGPLAVRDAEAADLPFLLTMLVEAANWDGTRGTTPASVVRDPQAWHYLEGWRRPTDFGIVATDDAISVGAAWARFLRREDAGYGYVDDSIPELTLAVAAEVRGRGVGRKLLAGLVASARNRGLAALSLSVEDGNTHARTLYKRVGFVPVGRNGNSDTMLLRLQP